MQGEYISAVVLLLLVLDPFGNIPIFIAALREVPAERRRRVILRECLIAFVVLSVFVFIGGPFLELLGLSETSLQIGGAVVLMLVALRMVFPTEEGVYGRSPAGERRDCKRNNEGLAGPSGLATVLLLVAQNPARRWEWIAAIAMVIIISAAVLAFAEKIQQVLGEKVTTAFERLMGLVLAAIAVELMLRGIRSFVATL